MPLFEVNGNTQCELCGEELVINARLEARFDMGVCNECGMPHTFSPANPIKGAVLSSAEETLDPDHIDWEVIEAYYEATGNRAVTIACCEATEKQCEQFDEWANEEFDMHWGMTIEEIEEQEGEDYFSE